MKVGIIGTGVVGGAVLQVFKERGLKVTGFDKAKPDEGTWEDVIRADVLFLCLPTPTLTDGTQDLSALSEVLAKLTSDHYAGVVVIKSTVLPGTTDLMRHHHGLNLVHNPEFLTAATPVEDFRSQKAILIGGPEDLTSLVAKVYLLADFHVVKQYTQSSTTEMAKYIHNVFLACKVSLFNEFYEFAKAKDIDFADARDGALSLGQIGAGHSKAPGPDGKPGFGGMCFVKDTLAFQGAQVKAGLKGELNSAAITQNRRVRPEEYKV